MSTHEVLNGKLDSSKQGVQRIICPECHDFKIITKLPAHKYDAWSNLSHFPEEKFLEGLRAIDGVSQVEAQTYTLETINLMGKIRVPKAAHGCMSDNMPMIMG